MQKERASWSMFHVAGQNESLRIANECTCSRAASTCLQTGLGEGQVLRQLLLGGCQPQPFFIPLELSAAHLLLDRLHLLLQPADHGQLALHKTSLLSARHHDQISAACLDKEHCSMICTSGYNQGWAAPF